jgi:hypothetical protein
MMMNMLRVTAIGNIHGLPVQSTEPEVSEEFFGNVREPLSLYAEFAI